MFWGNRFAPRLFLSCILFLSTIAGGNPLENWAEKQASLCLSLLLDNLSPAGTLPGTVVASPSKANPDYFYHWTRDASIVMQVIVSLYENSTDSRQKAALLKRIHDFVHLTERHQKQQAPTGLGEPKFHTDGTPFTGPWGRPQNDGPALRALVLIRLAQLLLDEGSHVYVKSHLYDGYHPTRSVIKKDLEYVSHFWREKGFDLWEELQGDHFYTRIVQFKALREGAKLARRLGDPHAAHWYDRQASRIAEALEKHWDPKRGIIQATLQRTGGIDYKHSGLDTAVILGVLHAYPNEVFPILDPRVLATAVHIEESFKSLYPVNQRQDVPGVAIGRYPEDKYNGYHSQEVGNPWVLTTLAFAQFYYRLANELESRETVKIDPVSLPFFQGISESLSFSNDERIEVSEPKFALLVAALRNKGDRFLARVKYHTPADGHFAEQINRISGFHQGAPDLTWSYESFLNALAERTWAE